MATWTFSPLILNGVNINDGTNFVSKHMYPDQPMQLVTRSPVELEIPGDYAFPVGVRAQPQSGQIVVHTHIKTETVANLEAYRRAFDRMNGEVQYQVNINGTTHTMQVRVIQVTEDYARWRFTAVLYCEEPIFKAATVNSDGAYSVTVSGSTHQITPSVGGTVRAYPTHVISPTAQKSAANGQRFRMQMSIAWRSELPGQDSVGNGYPIDIVDGLFDTAAEVAAVRMQADGDDLRVYVDGVEFPRALSGINTANTKVWVPIHFSPGKSVTVEQMLAAGVPSTGGVLNVSAGQSLVGWPERGSFLVDTERIWYGTRTDTQFQQIERGWCNTTAAAHAAGATADWVEHEIDIVHGWTSAPTPTAALFALSTSLSTNLAHTYNASWASPAVQRYGQMTPRFTEDNIRSQNLSFGESPTILFFADAPSGGTRQPANNVELYAPCGVKAAASALAFDVSGGDLGALAPGSDIALNLRVYGIDIATGVETLLATYNKANRTGAKTITPAAVLSRVRLNAVYKVITGAWISSAATDKEIGPNTDELLQRFTLDADVDIEGYAIWARESAGGDTSEITLFHAVPTGGTPEPRDTIGTQVLANALFSTTYGWRAGAFVTVASIRVPAASTYHLVARESAGAGIIYWGRWATQYAQGEAWDEAASTWTRRPELDHGFLVLGDGSVVQDEAPSGMEGYANFDNIVVTFDNTTPRTPKIVKHATTPRQNAYLFENAVLAHNGTSQTLTLNYICTINSSFTINCATRTVSRVASRNQFVPYAVDPSDKEQWMHFQGTNVGADNVLQYTDTGIGTVQFTHTWQNAWG